MHPQTIFLWYGHFLYNHLVGVHCLHRTWMQWNLMEIHKEVSVTLEGSERWEEDGRGLFFLQLDTEPLSALCFISCIKRSIKCVVVPVVAGIFVCPCFAFCLIQPDTMEPQFWSLKTFSSLSWSQQPTGTWARVREKRCSPTANLHKWFV